MRIFRKMGDSSVNKTIEKEALMSQTKLGAYGMLLLTIYPTPIALILLRSFILFTILSPSHPRLLSNLENKL